jgi:hypothetical protein
MLGIAYQQPQPNGLVQPRVWTGPTLWRFVGPLRKQEVHVWRRISTTRGGEALRPSVNSQALI